MPGGSESSVLCQDENEGCTVVLTSQILRRLPGALDWMVLFDLPALRGLIADPVIMGMFSLTQDADLGLYSHVVLTSRGPLVASREGSSLISSNGGRVCSDGERDACLYDRYSDRFDLFPVDEADCLAVGEASPFPPVLLHLKVTDGFGEAKAVFAAEPSGEHYELLKAVGVEYLGGGWEGAHFVARFRNHLPTHVHAGMLAHFSRTGHCNQFFLRHGSIDRGLERGLVSAASSRVTWAARKTQQAVARLARETCAERLALTCQPPPPARPFPFGDLVPLGFLLKASNASTDPGAADARAKLQALLQSERQGSLWSYHTGGLATSTDSALVLQGFQDPDGVEALEAFADGGGGYYPQLSSDEPEQGRMLADNGNKHWRQPDFGTTCLVRALRAESGLGERTSVEYLEDRFETRSGLYFANPYLVDWALALALIGDPSARGLRQRLGAEILAGIKDDYSFGHFDVPMSSAFAVLALAALGYAGRTLRMAQLRLLEFMDPDGAFPSGTPFYSTVAVEKERVPAGVAARAMLGECRGQVIWVNREFYEVSLYRDSPGMTPTAVAALALLAPVSPEDPDPAAHMVRGREAHPRYESRDQLEYVQKFALPPYLNGSQ